MVSYNVFKDIFHVMKENPCFLGKKCSFIREYTIFMLSRLSVAQKDEHSNDCLRSNLSFDILF